MDFFSSAKRNGKRNENPDGKKSGHLQVFSCVEIIQVGKKPGRSMDFFSSAKRNGKRNENPDGKKSGHLQVFFWWKLSRWKKNLEDLRIFFL